MRSVPKVIFPVIKKCKIKLHYSMITVAIATSSSVYVASETRVTGTMYDMMKILLGG